MQAFLRASTFAVALICAAVTHAADAKKFNLNVIDEQGQPVPKFEALIYSGAGLHWAAGENGVASLSGTQIPSTASVIVRAEGYASTMRQFWGGDREKLLTGQASMTLQRGNEVKLTFHLAPGMTWPAAALPDVYFEPWKEVVQTARSAEGRKWYESRNGNQPLDLNMFNLRPEGAGTFALRVAENQPEFKVGIDIPGFLRYFDDGPFNSASFKNGTLEINVPQPASLEVTFNVGNIPREKLPFKAVTLSVLVQSPERKTLTPLFGETVAPGAKPLQLANIPAGNYVVSVITHSGDGNLHALMSEDADPSRFRDNKQVSLRPGQTEKIVFDYLPLDPTAFAGKRTAIVRFETVDGQPAANREVMIRYYVDHYGWLPVFSGPVPASGEVTLSDITDTNSVVGPQHNLYTVRIGNDQAGGFRFKTGDPTESFTFRCPPIAGDMAPEVELVNVADGKTIKLSDLRGKLVLLDFWATWCGPCQPALEKLDQVAAEKADAWKDRVAIVPVSIDDDPAAARQHLIDRGWTHLNTFWTGAEGKVSFEAPAMQAFLINGVPTSFLIDPQGKILWRGHPLSNEGGKTLEDRIEAALGPAE